MKSVAELRTEHNEAVDELEARIAAYENLDDDASEEDENAARAAYESAKEYVESRKAKLDEAEALQRAKSQFKKVDVPEDEPALEEKRSKVDEPEMYRRGGPHSFIDDLFRGQIKNDPIALERVHRSEE